MSATNRGCERKAYDFYATPPETVRAFLANFDGISSGDRILEPSAGNGQIVNAASRRSGIKISTWNYRSPVRIRNILGD